MTVDTESAASLCVRAALTPWLLDLTPSDNPARESRVYFIQSGSDGPIKIGKALSLIHISEPTRRHHVSRMPSSA